MTTQGDKIRVACAIQMSLNVPRVIIGSEIAVIETHTCMRIFYLFGEQDIERKG